LKDWLKNLFPNLRAAATRWSEDDASSMAASVAYYLALSLFPMVLVLTSGLLSTVSMYGSPVISKQFSEVLAQLESQAVVTGPFGVFTAIMAAIGVFSQLDRGFDRVWRTGTRRDSSLWVSAKRILHERFSAFLMLVCLGGMVALLFAGEMVLSHFRSLAGATMPSFRHVLGAFDLAFTTFANACLFCMLYKFLPKQKVGLGHAFRGGLLAAVVWEIGRVTLGVFLIGMRYTSAYGVIGSFIALLLWCYYGVSIIYFGAEYVQVLQARANEKKNLKATESSNTSSETQRANAVVQESNDPAQLQSSEPIILQFKPAGATVQVKRQLPRRRSA
jgi:membrane protein